MLSARTELQRVDLFIFVRCVISLDMTDRPSGFLPFNTIDVYPFNAMHTAYSNVFYIWRPVDAQYSILRHNSFRD
jgi:hypothetical protein